MKRYIKLDTQPDVLSQLIHRLQVAGVRAEVNDKDKNSNYVILTLYFDDGTKREVTVWTGYKNASEKTSEFKTHQAEYDPNNHIIQDDGRIYDRDGNEIGYMVVRLYDTDKHGGRKFKSKRIKDYSIDRLSANMGDLNITSLNTQDKVNDFANAIRTRVVKYRD